MPLARIADVSADQWDALLPEDQPFLRHGLLLALEESGRLGAWRGWQSDHLLWLGQAGQCSGCHSRLSQDSLPRRVYFRSRLGAVPFSPLAELPDHLA